MSARTRFCALAAALAGAWLLLPSAPTTAQPPAGESTDQRLRRLEDKIDKLLASQPESKATDSKRQPPQDGSGLALLNQAAEKFKQTMEAAEQDYYTHIRQTQNTLRALAPTSVYLERLAKIEARRQQLQTEVDESEQNYALIEQAYKKDGKGVALQKLAEKGMKIPRVEVAHETLDKQFMALTVARRQLAAELGPAHPQIRTLDEQINFIKTLYRPGPSPAVPPNPADGIQTDSDVVQVILTGMKAETDSKKQRIQALNREFEAQLNDVLEMNKHEPKRLRLKARLDEAKQDFETALRAIREIDSRRSPK